jgi:hypothetical protein
MKAAEHVAPLREQLERGNHAIIVSLAVLGASSVGCTSGSRLEQNAVVPSRGTMQVWSASEPILLRDAQTLGDSLIGNRPVPESARAAVARTTIDSIRVQSTDVGKLLIVGTGVAIALLLAYSQGLGDME